jgi:thiamine kinase-like enzyme
LTRPIPADPASTTPTWLSSVTGCEIDSTQWIGIDFGLSGHCCRVIGSNGDGAEVDVVVKLTTGERARREIAFYRLYAPQTDIATPRFVGGAVAVDRGYLVLGTVADATQGDVLAGATRDGAGEVARSLARLHGRWWDQSTALDQLRNLSPPQRFLAPEITGKKIQRFLGTRADDLGLSPSHRHLIAGLETRLPDIHEVLWEGPPTLIHTDAHLDNVLWSEAGPVLIDWEGAMAGPAEVDVARLLIEGMTPTQYLEFGANTLEVYRSELAAGGAGIRIEVERVLAATLRSLAAMVEWMGGEKAPPSGDRARRLGRNAVLAALAVHDSLMGSTDL